VPIAHEHGEPATALPGSVFLWKSWGAWVTEDSQGNQVLAWKIDAVLDTAPGATRAAYEAELAEKGINSGIHTIYVNANSGSIVKTGTGNYAFPCPTSTATPAFSPDGGTHTGSVSVTISCADEGATIRYTTDGTNPTLTSTQYTAPVTISQTQTLKARAFKTGHRSSLVKSATYVMR
jgi:hypothetical protein